jgi:long-chain acyl-CoA synthetase
MTDIQQRLDSRPPTVGAMFNDRVAASPQAEAFRYPDDHGAWVSLTWTRTREIVWEIAAGLLALGLGTEERVAIASSTRIEWVLLDLAINCAGGATTTVYPNTQGEEFAHIITHSDSRIFVAENADQLAKLRDLVGTEKLAGVVLLDGSDPDALSLDALREAGRAHLAEHPTSVDDAVAATSPDTLATLIYTSGTTGLPKGVELVHSNWTYEGAAVDALGIIGPDSLQYFWLPLSHVFGKAVMMIQLQIGFGSVVDGRLDQIVPGLGATHPIFMCGAPRIFEKVRNAVKANTATGVKAKIARWAFAVGRESRPYRLAGQKLPFAMGIAYAIADRLVFSSLKEKMGGNIEFFISGSAKLSEQVQEWFYSAGIVIVEGYGLTETSAVAAVNEPHTPRFGTVGPALPGSEFRIAEDGEVLLKGPGRHARLPQGSRADRRGAGRRRLVPYRRHRGTGRRRLPADHRPQEGPDEDLRWQVRRTAEGGGRAGGQHSLRLPGGRRRGRPQVHLGAAHPGSGAVENWAKRHGKEGLSYAEVTQLPEMRVSIDRFMTRANRKLERWETVKKYQILDHELSVERGGVTANMKLRRAAISQDYADVIDSMYEVED